MTTSLAEQLKKLAVPQVLPLIHEKKRASLLFDPKEAAKFDRDTIFELGIDGLEELKNIDPTFSEFENTIFSVLSKSIERSVLSKEKNEKLNNNIQKYLLKLSPYFLLKPAHKTIEWLITRFHIHQYNVDDLLMLCFPYHETRMFVKVIQLFNLKDPAGKWHWLEALQKPGVPLSKTALLNHCASHSGFMSFICDMTLRAVKIHKDKGHVLATLYAFTCTTLMGALEHSKSVSEVHIMHIVKVLIKGLDSPVADFSAAAFMILAQLTRKCQLSEKWLTSFIIKISKNPVPSLNSEVVLLLTQIYQSQQSLEGFPRNALLNLMKRSGFQSIIGQLSMSGANVIPLLNCILKESLRCMMEDENLLQELKSFISGLLTNVVFEEEGIELVIQSIIKIFETCADSNNENNLKSFSEILSLLEKHYPNKFDSVIKKIMKTSGTGSTCKKLFQFIPNTLLREESTTLFEKINDHNKHRRIAGIKYLAAKITDIKESDKQLLIDSMQTRIADDCPEVIFAVLDSFSIKLLLELLGPEFLLKSLFRISQKCFSSKEKWQNLAALVTRILCSKQVVKATPNELLILITVIPFLIPTNSTQVEIAKNILSSYFAKKNEFLKLFEVDEKSITYQDLSASTFKHLCEGNNLPALSEVKEALSQLLPENPNATEKFLSILLLTSALKDNASVEECVTVLDFAVKYIEDLKVSTVENNFLTKDNIHSCLKSTQRQYLPLEGFSYCISVLINKMSLPSFVVNNVWWDMIHVRDDTKVVETAKLMSKLFEIIINGCSLENKKIKSIFIELLKLFFKKFFPDQQSQFRFLCNFWIGHELSDLNERHSSVVSYELQLRSLCFAASLLRQSEKSTSWMLQRNEMIVPALLVSLVCPASQIRGAALDCLSILGSSIGGAISQSSYIPLLDELLSRKEELILDSEQLPVIMYILFSDDSVVRTLVKSKNIPHMKGILESLVNCAVSENTPSYISAALLRILSNVSSKNVLEKIIPLGYKVIQANEREKKEFDQYSSEILRNIISRLNENTNDFMSHREGISLLETLLLGKHILIGDQDGKEIYGACLVLSQISKEVFESISQQQQQHLLSTLIEIGTDNDCPEIVSAVGQVWKRIILDSKLIVVELEKMRDAKQATSPGNDGKSSQRRKRITHAAPSLELLKSVHWKRGVTLLEVVQNKKKLNNVQLLVPLLFDILNRCLEFEQQAPVEYIKQLLLSCILHCCQKLSPDGSPLNQAINLKDEVLNVGLVVQCIRGTQNPQTHHHALLLLSHLAGMIPDLVLHNIMAIFTFMGSSILRQDDAYSFQVISKLVETIIPVLIEAGASGYLSKKMNSKLEDVVAKVMRVFVDALLDIPEHRRVPLFYKLLTTLNAEKFLWLFLCLVLENHVLRGSEADEKKNVGKKPAEMPKRLEFLMTIINTFNPRIIMTNCILVVNYLRSLPAQKESQIAPKKKSAKQSPLFDVENNTDKQLRHFKYTLVTFLSSLLSSTNFITEVAKLKEEEMMEMEDLYKKMIENILYLIQSVSHEAELNAGKVSAKYWKVMLNQCYDTLDKVNALLPSVMFLVVIQGLIESDIPTIRRKALELLNSRLQYQASFFTSCQPEHLLSILPPLLTIVKDISSDGSYAPEIEIIQQTALLSLKLLARILAQDNPNEFKKILELVTNLITSDLPNGNILASVLLCIAELCSTLRVNAIGYLPKIMPSVINVLKVQNRIASSDIVLLGVVTAVQKIIENLSHFLSPYMDELLLEICAISAKWQNEPENAKVTPIVQKLKAIRQKLSTVPSRVLVPSVGKCYSKILEEEELPSLGPLMSVLADSFSEMNAQELVQMMPDLTNFFQTALQLRSNNSLEKEQLCEAEEHVVLALVALVLKLSESSFRPLYYNLYHWATSTDVHKERTITFYRLSSCIAEKLKGLFVLFAGHFIKHAASMLDENNVVKSERLYFGSDDVAENKSKDLLEYVLKTLYTVFLYDSQSFVNGERFETLMQPIVDQLENTLGGIEALQERVKSTVTPCIVQFAVAAGDDTLWKQLNYQILLKTRHNSPIIRLAALETLCEVAKKLGEDFLPLLPETIPFLAELLEDEDESVEKASQKAVQGLEEVLGEPLQKYF